MHTGPRDRQGVRPPARGDRDVRRRRTSGSTRRAHRAQFMSGIIQPAMQLHLEPQLRRDLRSSAGSGSRSGQMSPRRRRRVHPVLAPVHVPDHPDGEHRERAPVGGRVGRAGVRAARRGRGDRRPGRARRAGARPAGRVAFEDVSFRYEPETPLIEDLSLVVEPGHDGRDRRARPAPARRRSSTC